MDHLLSLIPRDLKLLFCLHCCCALLPVRRGLISDLRKGKQLEHKTRPYHRPLIWNGGDDDDDDQRTTNCDSSSNSLGTTATATITRNDLETEKLLGKLSLGWISLIGIALSTLCHLYMLIELSFSIYHHRDNYARAKADALIQFVVCNGPRLALNGIGEYHLIWASVLVSLVIVVWRFYVTLIEYDLHMDFATFLLLSEDSLRRNVDSLNRTKPRVIEKYLQGQELDPIERILYFRMENYHRVEQHKAPKRVVKFFVRPNRTPKARRSTCLMLDRYFKVITTTTVVSVFLTTPICLSSLLPQYYLPELCRDARWVSWSWLWKFLASGGVSIVYWADGMIATLISAGIIYLLKEDLVSYWGAIEAKMGQIHARMIGLSLAHRRSLLRASEFDSLEFGSFIEECNKSNCTTGFGCEPQSRFCPSKTIARLEQLEIEAGAPTVNNTDDEDLRWSLKCECSLLRAQLSDFFEQVHRADKYVSLLGPFSVGFSQIMNAVVIFTGTQFDGTRASLGVRIFQLYGFAVASLTCLVTLDLKRRTDSAYGKLCSLMALDPSRNKTRWMPIIDIYKQGKHGFSVCHGGLFTWLLYLKIISYTFTITLFLENLRITNSTADALKISSQSSIL